MRLKQLATAAICVTALGGAVSAAPAAAKNDKPKHFKQCHERGHHNFTCETTDGDTVTSSCPDGYQLGSAFDAPANVDLNGNYAVCISNSLDPVDDTPVQ